MDQSYTRDETVLYVGTHFPELEAHAYQLTERRWGFSGVQE